MNVDVNFNNVVLLLLAIMTAWTKFQQGRQGKTLKDVHTLANSNMGEQLQIGAVSARTLANQTNLPEHIALANVAEAKLSEHKRKQDYVDNPKVASVDNRNERGQV